MNRTTASPPGDSKVVRERDGIFGGLGVHPRAVTGSVIGAAGLEVRSQRFRQGEISYIIHPDQWGHGYATEAARLLLAFGFSTLGLHRIVQEGGHALGVGLTILLETHELPPLLLKGARGLHVEQDARFS